MKNILIGLVLFLGALATASAQTPAQNLADAIRNYNSIREQNTDDKDKVAAQVILGGKTISLLENVKINGTEEERKTARYFAANLNKVLNERKNISKITSYNEFETEVLQLLPEFEYFDAAQFPLRYKMDDKSFIIQYANFAETRQNFFAQMAESYFRDADKVNTRKFALKAINSAPEAKGFVVFYVQYYLHYSATNEGDQLAAAKTTMAAYNDIHPDNLPLLDIENRGVTYTGNCIQTLKTATLRQTDGVTSLEVANILKKSGKFDKEAAFFYQQAYQKGGLSNLADAWEALDFLQQKEEKSIGLSVANQIEKWVSVSDCAATEKLSGYFSAFGAPAKATAFKAGAEKCYTEARKRAAEEERRRAKAARRANRNKVYVGTYILRLAQRPQYMDYGLALNIPTGERTYWELSYMKARNDQDYLLMERVKGSSDVNDLDNPHWDGFYAHIAMKKKYNSSKTQYVGFLLNYNERNFQPQISDIYDRTTNLIKAANVSFEPKLTAYGLMLNLGHLSTQKTLGIDMYYGIGASYNQFDLQSPNYTRESDLFSNLFLEKRKEQFWGFQVRIGLTVGLNL